MPEGWRRKLEALGGLEPDATRLRDRALHGTRLPDPQPGPGRAIVAGIVAIALAVGSFGLLRTTFGENRAANDDPPSVTASPDTSASPGASVLDPDTICQVPEYDPGVAILGDRFDYSIDPAVGPREFSLDLLEVPGEAAATIEGPATDELRRFLDDGQGRNAPPDGWRAIAESDDEVIFAAPPDGGYSDWWIVRFTARDGEWRFEHTELVEQHQTPAQLGRGLRLGWTGEVVFNEGRWESTLSLTNERDAPWTVGEDGYELRGHVHVFDPASGAEVGHVARTVGTWGSSAQLEPGASQQLPISLGGALLDLASDRTYDAIACVPELGLASPVGTVRVGENTTVRTARVLTYPDSGIAMQALGGGRIVIHNGCLAVANGAVDPRPTYVLWPDGYALVDRGADVPILIDAVGNEVARLGDDVTLGGGYVPPDHADDATIGGLPDECRQGGEGYFLTSGLASAS